MKEQCQSVNTVGLVSRAQILTFGLYYVFLFNLMSVFKAVQHFHKRLNIRVGGDLGDPPV